MEKKTIVLYSPKTEPQKTKPWGPPYSLLILAGLFLKEGYNIKIFDAIIDPEAQTKVLENLNDAICLGISVWTGYPIADSLELSEKVKKARPDIPIVWGSWHPSLFPEQTVENPNVDIVVRGQGEITFLELVKRLEKKQSFKNILGITYKHNGKIINNADRPRSMLDNLPPFPFHLINIEDYISDKLGKRTIGYVTSQGCSFNCSFCADAAIYGRKRYDFSAERVLKDIKLFVEKYDINAIWFEDTNFLLNKEKLLKICKGIIKNGWKIQWHGTARVNHFITFNKKELELIKKSGCSIITVGAESGSQKILDLLNKGFRVEDTIKFNKVCEKYKIGVKYDIMVGLPGEIEEDFKKTLELIRTVYNTDEKNELVVFFYAPFPGTPLYHKLINEGNFQAPKSLIEWSKFDPNHIETKWINEKSKEELKTFLFYLQLAYLNNNFKKKINNSKFKIFYLLFHKIALFRFNHDFFKFLIERKLYKIYKNTFK